MSRRSLMTMRLSAKSLAAVHMPAMICTAMQLVTHMLAVRIT